MTRSSPAFCYFPQGNDRAATSFYRASGRSRFGDVVLILFLIAQLLDGVFTYLGVTTHGTAVEANPILGWLMASVGAGPALAGAKLLAGSFGVALHMIQVHGIMALLTALYFGVAVVPWVQVLFFM